MPPLASFLVSLSVITLKFLNILLSRRQNNFQGEGDKGKNKTKNSIIKPPSTLSVLCMKIKGEGYGSPSPLRCRRLCILQQMRVVG